MEYFAFASSKQRALASISFFSFFLAALLRHHHYFGSPRHQSSNGVNIQQKHTPIPVRSKLFHDFACRGRLYVHIVCYLLEMVSLDPRTWYPLSVWDHGRFLGWTSMLKFSVPSRMRGNTGPQNDGPLPMRGRFDAHDLSACFLFPVQLPSSLDCFSPAS